MLHLPEKEPSPGALSSTTSAGWGTTPRSEGSKNQHLFPLSEVHAGPVQAPLGILML